jgi:hypothetical protein
LPTSRFAPISAISRSKAPAEVDWPPVGQQLAVMRHRLDMTERDARHRFGNGIHAAPIIGDAAENLEFFTVIYPEPKIDGR